MALLALVVLPVATLGLNAPALVGAAAGATLAAEVPIIVAAAGDVACAPGDEPSATGCRQQDTADVVVGMNPDAVLALGDLQYDRGTAAEFASYDASWGRFKSITHPIPGNHEYDTSGASGYYGYFGSAAGDPTKGYYSWDIGGWHMIALNSECSEVGGCHAGSPQETWLRADLAANPGRCTLAYFHHPLFASDHDNSSVRPFWDALYAAGADVVLNGHNHNYEHFGPQTPSGSANPSGLRQFVIGTGGVYFHALGSLQANTVARQADTFGVVKFSLYGSRYEWQFMPVAGGTFADSGSANCHNSSTQPPAAPTGVTVSGTPTASQVSLTWTASTGPDVAGYRVYRDAAATPLTSSPVPSTGYTDGTVSGGTTYSYAVTAVNTSGVESARSSPVSVTTPSAPPGSGVLDVPVQAGADDAEEASSGAVDLSSSDLELVTDGGAQTVGLRFTGVTVPAGARITSAYVQFQVDETPSAATNLTVAGQAGDNPPGFTSATRNISSRPRTTATVGWVPAAWPTVGARGLAQRTPDLAAVVQEIVSRPGWAGDALALVVTGSGRRTAEAFDSGQSLAPVLHVEYAPASQGQTNTAPVVSAGSDAAVTRPAAAGLAGSVSDDGLPNPPAQVTVAWSTVSGPGTVTFANGAAASTTASFSAAGDYVLRLTGNDGALQTTDDMSVTVSDPAPGNVAPVVNAGTDVSVTRPAAAILAGSVSDDGLPNPPAQVTAAWSTVSGPGTVTFENGAAASTTASFSAAGAYVLRLTGSDSALQSTDDVTVTVTDTGSPPTTRILDVPVRTGADDAEERTTSGAVTLGSGDLNLGLDGTNAQIVAIRLTGVALPVGATISNAYVQFQVDEVSTAASSVTVTAQAADTAEAFTATARNVSARTTTTSTVSWTPASWPTVGARTADQRTPNLAAMLQEIVSRTRWASGNAVVLMFTGTGTRVAESFDGGAARAPVLHIEYTV